MHSPLTTSPSNKVSQALTSDIDSACHIWRVDLSAFTAADIGILSVPEQEKSGRFSAPLNRSRYIAAHCALRRILGRYTPVAPHAIEFEVDIYGRPRLAPFLARPLQIDFNLSHSEDVALIGVSGSTNVGTDVEVLRDIPDAHLLASRYFTNDEYRHLLGADADTASHLFLSCWTRKEAAVKCTGYGLRCDPRELHVGFEGRINIAIHYGELPPSVVCVTTIDAGKDVVAACAMTTPVPIRQLAWPEAGFDR